MHRFFFLLTRDALRLFKWIKGPDCERSFCPGEGFAVLCASRVTALQASTVGELCVFHIHTLTSLQSRTQGAECSSNSEALWAACQGSRGQLLEARARGPILSTRASARPGSRPWPSGSLPCVDMWSRSESVDEKEAIHYSSFPPAVSGSFSVRSEETISPQPLPLKSLVLFHC